LFIINITYLYKVAVSHFAQEMVTLDKGSAMFDAGETVVRTDNFAKLTDGINELIGVTQANKPPKPWAKWETATLYR
jgi:hypothetical protein